ncbi:CHC2 zinc finger domain-containing protein [Burkholderia sp. D-99]|uniref:CHC2 zinc finger domain-containing protein n=1 Tax=Burkholderia sp. D-99 TaxID=2717316 RepID=UPI001423CF4F|nr:CHC2 zinc finger domain-containing protein [Burkholderia sp. D-99]NHV26803.1 hypothetical protein [Burkholderia sp. D-99]
MSPSKPGSHFRRLIDQLADTVQIDELAERLGIPVKRVNGRVSAQCLFHNDTDPSMVLYRGTARDKPHFHCFVCDAHGDIFELVKQAKGVDFSSAVRWLASAYGLAPATVTRLAVSKDSQSSKEERKVESTLASTSAFERALVIYRQTNPIALEDWIESRELSKDTGVTAELGFADSATLIKYLGARQQDFGSFRELLGSFESAGLVRLERKKVETIAAETHLDLGSQYRDFFNDGRVIFPIRDVSGRLLGFAGRRVKESTAPKYLYSPGLPKSHVLYRANVAFSRVKVDLADGKKPILYVCEGLVDALRLESLGLPAVALLGARLSDAQARLIVEFAATLPDLNPLQVRFFLDKDGAGLKGAAASIDLILKLDKDVHLEMGFIWPLDIQAGETSSPKDPDEILRQFEDRDSALAFLDHSTHPVAVAFLAERLNVPPLDILVENRWEAIPLGAKYRLAVLLESIAGGLVDRVLTVGVSQPAPEEKWRQDLLRYLRNPVPSRGYAALRSPEEAALRLNIARELAQSGANKGEVLSDIAAWRRISLAATAFNQGFASRLRQAQFQPIEPFDAVFVSRGFGKDEARLKAMPCPEDLVVQQYVMNELLTERLDYGTATKFSNYIPAVRYYRSLNHTRTTGETEGVEQSETISFAYQVDMDAVEGRKPPGEGGMFRPYFECWKEFISSLLRQGGEMSHVHMVRLDLKRYYDNIKRLVAKDVLTRCIESGYESLGDGCDSFAPLFQPGALQGERQRAIIDFLLDQSFGFDYYHPNTGNSVRSDSEKGIPQGPVLSAWLGNVILFRLDEVMRAKRNELNRDGVTRAGYARYVDDVVLLADSQGVLDFLRAAAEGVTRMLQLELVSKESFAPMSTAEFLQHLTSGRALPASGPREEAVLLESGDGDAGWDMWQTESPRRQTSLELLRDSRLYTLPADTIQNQVFTALRAEDLRPAELAKASRWLWYQAAQSLGREEYNAQDVVSSYWKIWGAVCFDSPFILDTQVSWDDPAFHALEGLENLLERANRVEFGLTPEEEAERIRCIAKLARVVRSKEFVQLFDKVDQDGAPPGWGYGIQRLRRMFFQRVICMRWKAVRLTDDGQLASAADESTHPLMRPLGIALQASLRRSLITDAETWGRSTTGAVVTAGGASEWNILSESFQWLHRAIVELGTASDDSDVDPLSSFAGDLERMKRRLHDDSAPHFSVKADKFLPVLQGLLPQEVDPFGVAENGMVDGEIVLLSLQALAAIAPRQQLAHLLSKRGHLLQDGEQKLPLPPLPGVPARGLLLVSHAATDAQWTKISAVWWMTLPESDGEDSRLPGFRLASADGDVQELVLDWQQMQGASGLQTFRASWDPPVPTINALLQPPALPATAQTLAWVADAYESIARLNHHDSTDREAGETEFVAAWPYLTVNVRPNDFDGTGLRLTLLSPRYQRSSLDGLAFIRNGVRGLRTYDVPELYGHHWRTGVLLSDLFGFRRDLDQYAALGPSTVSDQDAAESLDPATHLLRNVLRKLRGTYANGHALQSQPGQEHLPATIARSLELLRKYPRDGEARAAIAYVLSSETETAGMHARLMRDLPLERPGMVAAFLEQVATKVISRVPLGWAGRLDNSNDVDTLSTSRVIPESYWVLANRFASLRPATEHIEDQERSFTVLIAGLRIAAITAWLREILLAVEALPTKEEWPFPDDGDLAEAWQLEEGDFLLDRPDASISLLTEFFREKVRDGASEKAFANITPLGWLVLLAGRIGLLGGLTKRPLIREWEASEIERARDLAISLSSAKFCRSADDGNVDPNWPFEFERPTMIAHWLAPSFAGAATVITDIEANLGLRHVARVVAPWKLEPLDRAFTDANGVRWVIASWQIRLSGGTKPERVTVGKRLLSIWDETRDAEGNLLIVSARDARLGKLLSDAVQTSNELPQEAITDTHSRNDVSDRTNGVMTESGTAYHSPAAQKQINDDNHELPASENVRDNREEVAQGPMQSRDSTTVSRVSVTRGREQWGDLQRNAWQLRRAKSPGHVRIALMQWDLNETYHHPAIDADRWNKQWPPGRKLSGSGHTLPSQPLSAVEDSRIEYRRRQFLTEALTACESFGVDLLVLPEYSVRPDTVGWLKTQLLRRTRSLSVLAGTYKLHGSAADVNFDRAYRDILGLTEYRKIFEPSSLAGKASRGSYISGEQSSMLTLLSPLDLDRDERVVCTFSRRKKYPSLAAAEIFNPPFEPLQPLYSTSLLLEELNNRSKGGLRVAAQEPVSAQQILHYGSKLRHLECIAEFVCSELFLPMSLANHHTLAAELLKLGRRFGSNLDDTTAMGYVREDIESVSKYLGIFDPSGEMKRRSILVVPAMTTRSADYWIFGQAALLAGGATTVFCNAVDKSSVGGSCFIGRNSWNGGGQAVHHDANVTPYAGWSKGIYYNRRSDALGETEQAMVIADIDPSFMQEGKPRPQALANPLQLVAYLPIVEMEGKDAPKFESDLRRMLDSIPSPIVRGNIVSPAAQGIKELKEHISNGLAMKDITKIPEKSRAAPFNERFTHWENYWNVNSTVGMPPVLVDWIWVESSSANPGSSGAEIFVLGYSDDSSLAPNTKS